MYTVKFYFILKPSKTIVLNNCIIRLVRMHVLEMAEGPWCVLWRRSRAECPRLVVIFSGPLMCPQAAQPYRMTQVGWFISMGGDFLGPLMCPHAAQPGRMPQVGCFSWEEIFQGPWCVLCQHSRAECHRLVTIFTGLVVFLGPLMCPLSPQPGRMPQVGYDICRIGSFFRAPDVSSGGAAEQNAIGWLWYLQECRAPDVSSGSTAGQNAPGWLRYLHGRYFFQGPWCVPWQRSRAECPGWLLYFHERSFVLGPLICLLIDTVSDNKVDEYSWQPTANHEYK